MQLESVTTGMLLSVSLHLEKACSMPEVTKTMFRRELPRQYVTAGREEEFEYLSVRSPFYSLKSQPTPKSDQLALETHVVSFFMAIALLKRDQEEIAPVSVIKICLEAQFLE